MEKQKLLYEGKAKQVYQTDDPALIVMHYKDDATAYNGIKKAQIKNKGIINSEIAAIIFNRLHEESVPTHFIRKLNEREHLCKKIDIIKLEVIVRNIIAGSMAKRLNIKEGMKPPNTIYELCYKNDDLGDPLINDHHAVALGTATYDDLKTIYKMTEKINNILIDFFDLADILLINMKIEFGKTNDGQIVLADEISPDSSRLWDKASKEILDKDRFRRDMGRVAESYQEILDRLTMCKKGRRL
ncbi:MAG TPA: phosphoribosylaminoimidazolesuccinocarboxamide synthase [Bacillota bacterium]|nr:phosphoribosylaminoimidazolesuccinocarboxamide synthase [Bacillota bacterium]